MSVNDNTEKGQTETISFEFDLAHPPRKVWRALTDPKLLADWLLPAVDFDLRPEATFTFLAPPQPGWDGIVRCRFIEIEPHRKLRWTWTVGEPGSDFFLDTVVTFTLTPTDAGTRLSLVQEGFQSHQKRNFGGARYGWRMMGEKLVDLLATTPDQPLNRLTDGPTDQPTTEMNLTLWILQVLLALHTVVGAMWKFSNSEQAVPSLSAIPHAGWMALIVVELLCAVGLVLPAVYRPASGLAPIAAMVIAAEMLLFCGVHIATAGTNSGELVYWLVVAAVCAFIAYGRFVVRPI